MIRTDSHLHTNFSADSETPVETMVEQGIQLGLTSMCFTDHMDLDYPEKYSDFTFDTIQYWNKMQEIREIYREKMDIRIGIEMGLQPHLEEACRMLLQKDPYDFVIGSVHLIGGWDVFYQEEHPELSTEDMISLYFAEIEKNIKVHSGFHTVGHLDYVVRYVEGRFDSYDWRVFEEQIEPLLRLIIHQGTALEVNTSSFKYSDGTTHPNPGILKKYRQMGGELLTIGSDAHTPEGIGIAFQKTEAILKDAGFSYYTIFRDGKPEFLTI